MTHKKPTRKKIEATKYSPKKKKKKFKAYKNTPKKKKKNRTHEIPTRKNFGPAKYPPDKNLGPTKYSREKISDPRKHDGTRPMEFSTLYFIYMVGVVVKHIFTVVLSTIKINKFVHLC